jgi:hypothetical protein
VQRAPGFPCALVFEAKDHAQLGRIAPRDRGLMWGNLSERMSDRHTPRKSGVSSTRRPLGSSPGLWNTGPPAFAGGDTLN